MRHSNRRSLGRGHPPRIVGRLVAIALIVGWAPGTLAEAEAPRAAERPAADLTAASIRIDPPVVRHDRLTVRLRGRDHAGPRALVLWREEADGFRRAGETRSGRDGRFDFGERPRPVGHTSWVVAPLGEAPDPHRSIRVEGPVPAPAVTADGPDARLLHVQPALYEGALRIRDAETGRLLIHRPIEPMPDGALRLDLDAEGVDRGVRRLEILQWTDRGIRSERGYWSLDGAGAGFDPGPSRPAAW